MEQHCFVTPAAEGLLPAAADELAGCFGALSDPIRLRLLSLLISESEVCSCNLEAPLERSQSTISHHTKVLAEAGLIEGVRRGRWIWWRVTPARLEWVRQLLALG